MKTATTFNGFMTLQQAADATGLSRDAVYRALRRGELERIDSGTATLHLVAAESVRALARRYAENPPKPGPPPRQTPTAKAPGVTVPEAARLLNRTPARVYQLLEQGKLKACAVRPYKVALSSLRKHQEER